MSVHNKEIVRRVVEELWNQGKLEIIDEVYHPDYKQLDPGNPLVTDLDSFRAYVEMLRNSFPDLHVDVDDMIAEGDAVAKLWTLHATFTTDFLGIPANNEPISVSGITVYRLSDDKIKECVWGYDNLSLMQQMGAIPAQAASA